MAFRPKKPHQINIQKLSKKQLLFIGSLVFVLFILVAASGGDNQSTTESTPMENLQPRETQEQETQEEQEVQEIEGRSTEAERKQIFGEIVVAQDRAMKEADELYPLNSNVLFGEAMSQQIDKNINEQSRLTDIYEGKIYQKYSLTEDEVTQIIVEGVKRGWLKEF